MSLSVDASNACIPPTSNLSGQCPPLPTTERGVPLRIDGSCGRLNSSRPLIVYPSGRLVIVRQIQLDGSSSIDNDTNNPTGFTPKIKSFIYRGHTASVTVAKFSPSGYYIASGDNKGKLRIWSYDNPEHLCKLDYPALAGPIHDLAWDMDSKRLVVMGEGSPGDPNSVCCKVIQWDTGVKVGDLGQHLRKKGSSCDFRLGRPMRVVTGGSEDFKCIFNKGPPFGRVVPKTSDGVMVPAEVVHSRGAVHCVRFNKDGSLIASVGTDKALAFYDGKTMELKLKMENIHSGSVYSCAWSGDGKSLLTTSADGTAKLIQVNDNGGECEAAVANTWKLAEYFMNNDESLKRTPIGGMAMGCAFILGDVPIAVGLNGNIAILSKSNNEIITSLTGHQAPISSLAIDEETSLMYTSDSNGAIVQWDVTTCDAIGNIQRSASTEEGMDKTAMNKVHNGAITGLVCVDGFVLSIGWDDCVRISSSNSNSTLPEMNNKIDLEAQPNAICKGTKLVVILTVNGLQLMKDNLLISSLIKLPYEATSICVSADDSTIYVGGRDHNIHMYDANSMEEVNVLTGMHVNPIYALALSNDGTKLASADTRDVSVWDVEAGYEPIVGKSKWCFHQQRINALAWSKDDCVLASGANDDSIYFWSLKKMATRVHYQHSHRGGVSALKFLNNEDGMVLVSVGNDACVNEWDVTDDLMKKFG